MTKVLTKRDIKPGAKFFSNVSEIRVVGRVKPYSRLWKVGYLHFDDNYAVWFEVPTDEILKTLKQGRYVSYQQGEK